MTLPVPPFDPTVERSVHRISTVIATTAETVDLLRAEGRPPSEFLRLGRLEPFYIAAVQQLPRVLACRDIDADSLKFRRGESTTATVCKARLWLFDVQAGPVVAVFSVDVECAPKVLIPFLEDCYYDHVMVESSPLERYVAETLDGADVQVVASVGVTALGPQRHQMVFTSATLPEDTVQRIVYRADLDWNPVYSSIQFPAELNRRPSSGAAVGAYVSVLSAQQDYIENCALLSAVQIVAATGKIRQIRLAAYDALLRIRDLSRDRTALSTAERRAELVRINETMAEQELQLTFGVETACEIGILIPALRVENFHRQLIEYAGLTDNVSTVSAMLARLASVLGAEQASQDSIDARKQDLRRLRYGVAVGFLSVVAVPIGIILGFFGGSYREVDAERSIFDWRHYYPMYLSVLGLVFFAGAVFLFLFWRERRELGRVAGTVTP
ncbi:MULTISPECIES: hypothetical protein [unclassified Frankia]|uniref:hypothetical protein n=1 Tax=unclassified Frankia TaxID=2632575 RepID=UPI002AD278AC|nr:MULTISPECIES: hypothetical protein [unclassified Frankia]